MKTRFLMSLATAALALTASLCIAQTDALAVRSMAASCSNCHGTNGNAVVGAPMVALAGYDKALMVKNMADFKSGARPATIMHQLAKGYSEAQIEAMAGYFAAQKK